MVPDVKHNEAYISFIFTHPEWRRAGIASFMLYHLIQVSLHAAQVVVVSLSPFFMLYHLIQVSFLAAQVVVVSLSPHRNHEYGRWDTMKSDKNPCETHHDCIRFLRLLRSTKAAWFYIIGWRLSCQPLSFIPPFFFFFFCGGGGSCTTRFIGPCFMQNAYNHQINCHRILYCILPCFSCGAVVSPPDTLMCKNLFFWTIWLITTTKRSTQLL